jgi:hypothetical protein
MHGRHAGDRIAHRIVVAALGDIPAPYVRDRHALEVRRCGGRQDLEPVAQHEHHIGRVLGQEPRYGCVGAIEAMPPYLQLGHREGFLQELRGPLQEPEIGPRAADDEDVHLNASCRDRSGYL